MNHNKNYFLLHTNINFTNDGTGQSFNNISLRYILGQLYDKYNAFSIKLEGFINRIANTAVIEQDFLLLHLEGLPFFPNGFDTCQRFNNSRVLEMIDYSLSSNRGYNFISNCNAINFWKPSTEKVNLKLFNTKLTDETYGTTDDSNYVFSITGLDAYKVIHPTRDIIVPRFPAMKTISFSLRTCKGESIDFRNRAFIFRDINLRQLIGSDYDKYKKFVLISKSYGISEAYGNDYISAGNSGFYVGNILISGFNWFRPSRAQYINPGTLAQAQEINNVHTSPPCILCQVTYGVGSYGSFAYKETYIENCFEKSKDVIDIVISTTQIYAYSLTPYVTTNTTLFPHFVFQFDIVPLEDY